MKKILFFLVSIVLLLVFTFKTFALHVVDGGTYPNGVNTNANNDVFGDATVYKCGYHDKIKKIKEDNYKNSYVELNKYFFMVFKYYKPLDTSINFLSGYHYVEKK